ncbi:MAG: FHA domain-containing protein [Gammaproteobacteria bacterium]|nr:FHA domain-containing protein [Gammaproteobacteria bacterium]MCW8987821.1 FHA domain-containing protein [Gammaproteobacteria bacterium]MCW9030505.1 FHA domain-containing protein [Gammaproteobacteria bacterium]
MAYLTQYSGSVPVIKFNIDQTLMTIGQGFEMDICVPEEGISDYHAAIEAIKQDKTYRYIVKSREDEPLLDINGETLSHAELKDGDWLTLGGVEFQFKDDGINNIKEVEISSSLEDTKHNIQPRTKKEPNESDALALMKELKQEVESIKTKTEKVIEDNRFSRRLSLF